MALTAVDYAYVYAFPSLVETNSRGKHLRLATCGGLERNPYFFQGKLVQPRRTADLLLLLSEVSRTRFYSPAEVRERLLAAADPVVTSGGERLRFEAFSVCCGVYARLDLRPEAIDGDWIGRGTTNVDFNPPMRAALAAVINSESVGLNVGAEGVELERQGETVVEKKVKLPVRWLKGFVEVQSYQSRLKPILEVSGDEARRFFSTLPKQQITNKGTAGWIVPAGKGLRLSSREMPSSVPVGAAGRLKVLEPVLRHARKVHIYGGAGGVSGWELVLDDCTFHFILSPDASRGFSGEGQALTQLTRGSGNDAVAAIRAALQWQAKIDAKALAGDLKMDEQVVQEVLATLGSRGLVGFDIGEGAYFHRELPFNMEQVEDLHPRLLGARKLVEENGVRISKRTSESVEAYVKGSEAEHRVIIKQGQGRCTCAWAAKHPEDRGACKHVLAVEIVAGEQE